MAANLKAEIIDLTELTESSGSEQEGEDEGAESDPISASDGSDAAVANNQMARAQLHSAIATVTEARLRQVLQNLVDSVPAVEMALAGELVTFKRKTREVVSRWEMCGNCDEEFDVNVRREDEECIFHPGELEVQEESFEDWDEDCHGPMDSSENRRQYPENFLWTCCDENATSEGCVHGEHRIARKKRHV